MKALLDTCVIYPTVMREMLLEVAKAGGFEPLWSARILEEWQRAAIKLGPDGVAQAAGELVMLKRDWPRSVVTWPVSLEARLWLPDPADVHVLAAAIAGHADAIVTVNAKDFPRGVLAEEGLSRADPDAFLVGLHAAQPDMVAGAAAQEGQVAAYRQSLDAVGCSWARGSSLPFGRASPQLALCTKFKRCCVDGSLASALASPERIFSMSLARTFPNSTPHWSKELMPNMTPSTKTRCS